MDPFILRHSKAVEDLSFNELSQCVKDYIGGGYMYSLRLDIDKQRDGEDSLNDLKGILSFLKSPFFVIYYEISKKTNKPHFQGYFFRLERITKNYQEKYIAQFFKEHYPHYMGTRRSISVLKHVSYYSYCSKQKNLVLERFPSDISADEWYSHIPPWKDTEAYKLSKNKSLKNDIFDIKPEIINDERKCVKEIVRIFLTYHRGFSYYDIISKYNALHATQDLEGVVDDIIDVMNRKNGKIA